ncbi:MAG: DNA-binding protein WhiA [Clostridia bacterium]|nr:DNA-binding protein WhiA [Clostridia bacterium]
MSFCFDTKQEICAAEEKNKRAMFYGMIAFADRITDYLQITTENVFVINLLEQLSSELFDEHFFVDENANTYIATLSGEPFRRICSEFHIDPHATQPHLDVEFAEKTDEISAFLKGAFLVGGSITNPQSAYHLELVCHHYHLSKEIVAFLKKDGFSFKSVVRKSQYVLYLKDSVVMERFLYVLGAKKAAFALVDAKIYKQIQNDNNRLNNCAEYNRDKMMDKAIAQLMAIQKIEKNMGLSALPDDLCEIAQLRLENQMASLAELCRLSDGKYSKAGLSRRLTKIAEIANKIDG